MKKMLIMAVACLMAAMTFAAQCAAAALENVAIHTCFSETT